MPTVEETIALTREARNIAEAEFCKALRAGRKKGMSWAQLATVAGMSIYGVRYLTMTQRERKAVYERNKAARKGEKTE